MAHFISELLGLIVIFLVIKMVYHFMRTIV